VNTVVANVEGMQSWRWHCLNQWMLASCSHSIYFHFFICFRTFARIFLLCHAKLWMQWHQIPMHCCISGFYVMFSPSTAAYLDTTVTTVASLCIQRR